VSATDGAYTDKVRVSWAGSTGAGYYEVYRSAANSSSGAALLGSPAAAPFEDLTASPGTPYWYFVKACGSSVCSAFSAPDEGYAAVTLLPPAVPSGLAASDGTYLFEVRVNWTGTVGAAWYELYRNDSDTSVGAALLGSPEIPSFSDTTAAETTPYWYFVKACNASGCSDLSLSDPGFRPVLFKLYLPLILR
jgi:hypothetical protein